MTNCPQPIFNPVLTQYYQKHGTRISQESEKLFVNEFLFPLLGERIEKIAPQHPFLDSTGRLRRIDFAYIAANVRLALEVNGETYHAEGIIPNDMFDDNLLRQNEILNSGYKLIRFSYSHLQSPQWRPIVMEMLRSFFTQNAPELLGENPLKPTPIQTKALDALNFYRSNLKWQKGVIVLPTGTGKTILSALDVKRTGGRALFVVHRLDILKQSIEAYRRVWPQLRTGILTGEERQNEHDCDVLFASKDSLRQPATLSAFKPNFFDYIVVDEVHHGQSTTYKEILSYFTPKFMLGMTATPDRLDRKDIFELFDYQKICEVTLQDAIEDGFLVPYDYYGLTDDVDYSKIRYQGNRYRVDDLEKLLIIPERNQAILREYLTKGQGDKAIGFCVSIKHAERMAAFFKENGVPTAAVTSETPNREQLIASFRRNELNVLFTVDLFNEGMDFPNVRVLLFLRPTESKTVFTQQLGRGLRLCTGKDRVRILDFIGNYKRANQIRQWLAKSSSVETGASKKKKVVYTYSSGCAVHFDAAVEQILDSQDAQGLQVTKEDLKEAYFTLAEELGHKPSRAELNTKGKYKVAAYLKEFESWVNFIREIGEYTEASYHYPQGVHLGHILSLLKVLGPGSRAGTQFDDRYIRLRGGYNQGNERLASYQRQIKYKLQAAMELGLIFDDRAIGADEEVEIMLTPSGKALYQALLPLLDSLDLGFPMDEGAIPSSRMALKPQEYNSALRQFFKTHPSSRRIFLRVFLNMPAVQQMLQYLYQSVRSTKVNRSQIYVDFFSAPFVTQFCDQEGIEEATEEAAKRRCPFLINVLDACGFISQDDSTVTMERLPLIGALFKINASEKMEDAQARATRVWKAIRKEIHLDDTDQVLLREMFGTNFLTESYHLKELEYIEGV